MAAQADVRTMGSYGKATSVAKSTFVETLIPGRCQEETLAAQASGILELLSRVSRNGWK
jgi:hypothetical protein